MPTHVAFLRAVNVGGRAVVKMTDVRAAFVEAGCRDVRTYIQSGNVLFDAPAPLRGALRRAIAEEVRALIGGEPVIVYRTLRDLAALVAEQPFGALTADSAVKLYVALLATAPKVTPAFPLALPKEALEAIGRSKATGDLLIVSRRKPNGMYGFPNNWIENALDVTATARNWSTVTKIAAEPVRPGSRSNPGAPAGRGGPSGTRSRAS